MNDPTATSRPLSTPAAPTVDPRILHIYRWDLDKTYLRTEFDTVRDLIRTALQKPEEKVNVPGAVALLRELTRERDEGKVLLTFISGSPTQMRDVLERKFELDGIHPDAFILKPTLQNILRGRFRAVRGQVGYKLSALLRVRGMTALAPETLFGDDAEQDAFIYSVYADLISGALDVERLEAILWEAEVYRETAVGILERCEELSGEGEVRRIFINLDRHTPPGRFLPFGPRIVPIVNYFQAALVLYADGVLPLEGLLRVAAEMIARDDYGLGELANSFQDLLRRTHLSLADVDRLQEESEAVGRPELLPPGFWGRLVARVRALAPRSAAPRRVWEGPPDYIEILRADRALKEAVTEKSTGLFG